jgi:MSHA biogenesis protein MshK
MVADLNNAFSLAGRLALVALCVASAAVHAEDLPDPTMPASEYGTEAKASSNSSSLQSIFISPTRRAAIINGQMIELGAKLGDVKLIEVDEGSVVLEGAQGRRVLSLFPKIKVNREMKASLVKTEINPAGTAADSKAAPGNKPHKGWPTGGRKKEEAK